MKEEMLLKFGEWIQTTANQIGEFAAREMSPFIHEYLTWKFWENIMGIGGWVLKLLFVASIVSILFKISKKLWGRRDNDDISREEGEFCTFGGVVSFILGLVGAVAIVFIVCNYPATEIKNCIQIKVAPKVFLIEEGVRLFKENTKQ